MSDKKEHEVPFLTLGSRLRRLRSQAKESLDEVAGAVEIASSDLEAFETGEKRPSEDILELLISHFSMKKPEADKLWKLAGYEAPAEDNDSEPELPMLDIQTIMVMPVDARVVYTDDTKVSASREGVVVSFIQAGGNSNDKPAVVGRLGMSKETAENLMRQLHKGLADNEPKALPPKASR